MAVMLMRSLDPVSNINSTRGHCTRVKQDRLHRSLLTDLGLPTALQQAFVGGKKVCFPLRQIPCSPTISSWPQSPASAGALCRPGWVMRPDGFLYMESEVREDGCAFVLQPLPRAALPAAALSPTTWAPFHHWRVAGEPSGLGSQAAGRGRGGSPGPGTGRGAEFASPLPEIYSIYWKCLLINS